MKNIARMTIAVLALSVGVAHAADPVADTKSAVKGSGTYGTAGCGLGSMAFGNQKGFIQVLAATTNGLFGTQTFGHGRGASLLGPAQTMAPSPTTDTIPLSNARERSIAIRPLPSVFHSRSSDRGSRAERHNSFRFDRLQIPSFPRWR